jgi:hypothetical protein
MALCGRLGSRAVLHRAGAAVTARSHRGRAWSATRPPSVESSGVSRNSVKFVAA